MDFTQQYKINNLHIINRLLPYYLRGKKIISFLTAVSSPIGKCHSQWLTWAQNEIIKSRIPFQTASVEHTLNTELKKYLINPTSKIKIQLFAEMTSHTYAPSMLDTDDIKSQCSTYQHIYSVSEVPKPTAVVYNIREVSANPSNRFNIAVPASNNKEALKNDIKSFIGKYTSITNYDIITV